MLLKLRKTKTIGKPRINIEKKREREKILDLSHPFSSARIDRRDFKKNESENKKTKSRSNTTI